MATLGILRRGAGDPTFRRDPDGAVWRGVRTPEGPASLRLRGAGRPRRVVATAWGPGAEWVAGVGAVDARGGRRRLRLRGRTTRRSPSRRTPLPGWRVPRTGLVIEALVPAILEQKVTGQEAFGGLPHAGAPVRRAGARARAAQLGLWVPPDAATWARIPSWEWLQRQRRRRPLGGRSCAPPRAAGRLEAVAALSHADAARRLRAVPGVGVWTAAEVHQRALGDPDAVSFGDYHVAKDIGWALTGSEVDDDGLAELLEPYAGHRYRVQRLLGAGRRSPTAARPPDGAAHPPAAPRR